MGSMRGRPHRLGGYLHRGATEATGEEYADILAKFEEIARRTQVVFLSEGPPDLGEKLNMWREKLKAAQKGD